MSNLIMGMTNRTMFATFNNKRTELGLSRTLMNSSYLDGSWFNNYSDEQEHSIQKAKNALQRVEDNFKRDDLELFVDLPLNGKVSELEGHVVYERNLTTFDEYQQDELKQVGTLTKWLGKWLVETDLEVIELKRRRQEFILMDKGHLSIGGMTDKVEYMTYLGELDKKSETGYYTRGHGL